MQSFSRLLILATVPLALAGCLRSGGGTADLVPPTNVAALNGGLVGQSSGLSLSQAALREALEAEYQALQFGRVGVPVTWQAEGARGEIVPTQLYRVGSQDCRGYTLQVTGSGANSRQIGTACRDGNLWTLV